MSALVWSARKEQTIGKKKRDYYYLARRVIVYRRPRDGRTCAASDRPRGGCVLRREASSVYCYYHSKLARGLTEPVEPLAYPVPLADAPYGYEVQEEAVAA